jgi:CobQ-like glutamine amidotransferase family enzyme
VEGACAGHIIATYMHGPVLARNPALADRLLGWAVGGELAPLPMANVDELRRERLARAAR